MSNETKDHRRALVRLLRLAYSGEKAAAYAYAGHWRSVKNADERATIQRIEQEEWQHRATVKRMLDVLNEKPNIWRELMMSFIGRSVSIGCFLIGWFLPMYFAGKLEHANVKEYDGAAFHAEQLGLTEFMPELHEMTKTEEEHEYFFSKVIERHWLLPVMKVIFKWDPQEVLLLRAGSEDRRSLSS